MDGFERCRLFLMAIIIVLDCLSEADRPRGEYVKSEPNSNLERLRLILMRISLAFLGTRVEIQEHLLDQKLNRTISEHPFRPVEPRRI